MLYALFIFVYFTYQIKEKKKDIFHFSADRICCIIYSIKLAKVYSFAAVILFWPFDKESYCYNRCFCNAHHMGMYHMVIAC
jgi:hypothetical protein